MDSANSAKIDIIANKAVSIFRVARVRNEKGIKKLPPSLTMLLKTNRERMPALRLARMFMKTGGLCYFCQDVDEK